MLEPLYMENSLRIFNGLGSSNQIITINFMMTSDVRFMCNNVYGMSSAIDELTCGQLIQGS